MDDRGWRCPVCGGRESVDRFVAATSKRDGVSAASFVPSSDRYGEVAGTVVRCAACGHSSLAAPPAEEVFDDAYLDAEDLVSLDEEDGQVRTASRDLAHIEALVRPGRLLDVGCWTGSFLVAANERGWRGEGIEPSRWASTRASQRGVDVRRATLADVELEEGAYRAIVACDVIEHLLDPYATVDKLASALEPGGVLFLTVPDAGSAIARVLGRRWWAVLPMHVQYFTRDSMSALLQRRGLDVVEFRTHPKVFSARYYADRFASFVPVVGKVAPVAVDRLHVAARAVAPDLRDRMAVLARAAA